MLSQWLGLALLAFIIVGLIFAFTRKDLTIRPDPENKPPNDYG